MWMRLLMLAQDAGETVGDPNVVVEPQPEPGMFVFHWWQGVLVLALIVVIVAYKKYRDKTMV